MQHQFGRLTRLSLDRKETKYFPSRERPSYRYYYKWLCACGKTVVVEEGSVKQGKTLSCGCLRKEVARKNCIDRTKHNLTNTRFYRCWCAMKRRCLDKNDIKHWGNYGGRGITFQKEWESFENFYKDMFPTYADNLTLDRIDVNRDYCKENCRWITIKEQQRNKRGAIFFNGENHKDASLRLGGNIGLVYNRVFAKKWSLEKAFTTPIRKW